MQYQRTGKMKLALVIATSFALVALNGCERHGSNELVNASNGALYRINKDSGEVSLIEGTQIIKLQEDDGAKGGQAKNYVIAWPVLTNGILENVTLRLKTNWRKNRMFYIFDLGPYSDRLKAEQLNPSTSATFHLNFYDSDGFQIFRLPIPLSQMSQINDDKGTIVALEVNTNILCPLETYETIKDWSTSWTGF
jgi:hypothetical protein